MATTVLDAENKLSEGTAATKGAIAQLLRQRIVAGELAPGVRLPTRSELEQHFGTTKVTVQRAFDDLIQDGFIVADGRRGTFVSQTPPHLTRFGLVFAGHPLDPGGWSIFFRTLSAEAKRIEEAGGRKIPLFYQVDQHHDSEDYRRLLREMRGSRLAGVIFAFPPDYIVHTPLMESHGIPLACLGHTLHTPVPAVDVEYNSFFDKALDQVARHGKKRVAVLAPEMIFRRFADYFRQGVQSRGLSTESYWWHPVHLGDPRLARQQTHLMMHPNQTVRPDALIIANDNLPEHVLLGLNDAGVRVPEDILLVAHCNFPAPSPPESPILRVGYDVRSILQACLNAIDMQRKGLSAPSLTRVSAVTEEEMRTGTGR